MVGSSTFWIVLVASVALWWLLPRRWRHPMLALVSMGYLASLAPVATLALAGWALLFHQLAPRAGKGGWRRWVVPGLVLLILGQLAVFKYVPPLLDALATNPTERTLVMPLGISYFTFKLVHYAIERGRGRITDDSLWAFLSYIFLFPIFTAGPIERFDHYLSQQEERLSADAIVHGVTRIIHGLIKKFLLADFLLGYVLIGLKPQQVLTRLDTLDTLDVWWFLAGSFAYAYLDFSAYSDLAIGASRLFGLKIMENFNFPFLARDIGDFWKRWHMTLAGWCQAYVYMPTIGLSRNPYLAVYATFVAMGLWHAGSMTWVCWGLYHATGVATFLTWNRTKRRRRWKWPDALPLRVGAHLLTLAFVTGSYAFTSIHRVGGAWDGVRLLGKLVGVDVSPMS